MHGGVRNPYRMFKWGLISAVISVSGYYGMNLYDWYRERKYEQSLHPKPTTALSYAQRLDVFNQKAAQYDDSVSVTEKRIGILERREKLMQYAEGQVLDVGVGTGANMGFFPDKVSVVYGVDASMPMLKEAKEKYERVAALMKKDEQSSNDNAADGPPIPVPQYLPPMHFQQMSAEQLRFPDNSFDTVIDTYGLCSYESPITALKEMRRVCKKPPPPSSTSSSTSTSSSPSSSSPSTPQSGRVLLLEHGRSTSIPIVSTIVSKYLDSTLIKHQHQWGCIHNLPIDDLVHRAGYKIIKQEFFHFGTGYFMVLEPDMEADGHTYVQR